MAKRGFLPALALLLALAGCGGSYRVETPAAGEFAGLDWQNARSCTLRVDKEGVEDNDLIFVAGEASVLEIRNDSEVAQSFEADAFFQDINAWKLVTFDPGSKLPIACGPAGARIQQGSDRISEISFEKVSLKAIDTDPGDRKLLYFVPKKAGYYSFECTLYRDAACETGNTITVLAAEGS